MILIVAAVVFVLLLLCVSIVIVVSLYRVFGVVRLRGLSMASRVDSVGGVTISVLCPSAHDITVVVALLSTTYPQSEVVVALNRAKSSNLVAQLSIRYLLFGVAADGVTVYRSASCCYRRLVVVVSEKVVPESQLLEIASEQARYNYLLVMTPYGGLLPHSLGVIADRVAEYSATCVDVVEIDSSVALYSRAAWQNCRDSAARLSKIRISEPIVLEGFDVDRNLELIERSQYNFWDFLSLNIMRYRNKLLSLRKP